MPTVDGSAASVDGGSLPSPPPAVRVVTEASQAPDAVAVQRLYAAAAALPPLHEPPTIADPYAEVYANSTTEDGLRVACSQEVLARMSAKRSSRAWAASSALPDFSVIRTS